MNPLSGIDRSEQSMDNFASFNAPPPTSDIGEDEWGSFDDDEATNGVDEAERVETEISDQMNAEDTSTSSLSQTSGSTRVDSILSLFDSSPILSEPRRLPGDEVSSHDDSPAVLDVPEESTRTVVAGAADFFSMPGDADDSESSAPASTTSGDKQPQPHLDDFFGLFGSSVPTASSSDSLPVGVGAGEPRPLPLVAGPSPASPSLGATTASVDTSSKIASVLDLFDAFPAPSATVEALPTHAHLESSSVDDDDEDEWGDFDDTSFSEPSPEVSVLATPIAAVRAIGEADVRPVLEDNSTELVTKTTPLDPPRDSDGDDDSLRYVDRMTPSSTFKMPGGVSSDSPMSSTGSSLSFTDSPGQIPLEYHDEVPTADDGPPIEEAANDSLSPRLRLVQTLVSVLETAARFFSHISHSSSVKPAVRLEVLSSPRCRTFVEAIIRVEEVLRGVLRGMPEEGSSGVRATAQRLREEAGSSLKQLFGKSFKVGGGDMASGWADGWNEDGDDEDETAQCICEWSGLAGLSHVVVGDAVVHPFVARCWQRLVIERKHEV